MPHTCDIVQQIALIVMAISNLVTLIITKRTKTNVEENTAITLETQAAIARPATTRTRATDAPPIG